MKYIGFDFDGPMADCGRLKTDAAKTMFGLDIPPERFKKEIVIGNGYLTSDAYCYFQDIIYGTREFGLRMKAVPGMLEYIPKLLARGHNVLVVTTRTGRALEIAKEWSRKHDLLLEFIGCGRNNTKARACSGLDVYIDDDLRKLEPLVEVVPNRYLFSRGYNYHVIPGTVAKRVSSWKEFFSAVEEL